MRCDWSTPCTNDHSPLPCLSLRSRSYALLTQPVSLLPIPSVQARTFGVSAASACPNIVVDALDDRLERCAADTVRVPRGRRPIVPADWLRGCYVFDGDWSVAPPPTMTSPPRDVSGEGPADKKEAKAIKTETNSEHGSQSSKVVATSTPSGATDDDSALELTVLKPAFEWPKPLGVRASPRMDSDRTGQRVPVGIQSRERVRRQRLRPC